MQEFEKRQEKGEVAEEELKKMEEEMSGKMLLVAWKGSKFEVSNVLRQVVDTGEFSLLLLWGTEHGGKLMPFFPSFRPCYHSPHQGLARGD